MSGRCKGGKGLGNMFRPTDAMIKAERRRAQARARYAEKMRQRSIVHPSGPMCPAHAPAAPVAAAPVAAAPNLIDQHTLLKLGYEQIAARPIAGNLENLVLARDAAYNDVFAYDAAIHHAKAFDRLTEITDAAPGPRSVYRAARNDWIRTIAAADFDRGARIVFDAAMSYLLSLSVVEN